MLLQRGTRLGIAAVADGDCEVTAQSGELRARHGAAFQQRAKLGIRTLPEIDKARNIESLTRLPRGVRRHRARMIVRADVLAYIAPVDMIADGRLVLLGDARGKLDCQVREAPRRIESARADEGARRTRIDAAPAGAALFQ